MKRITKKVITTILITLGCLFILLIPIFVSIYPLADIFGNTDFYQAKAECIKIFEKRRSSFIETAETIMNSKDDSGYKIKKVESIHYHGYANYTEIEFVMGSQGMMVGGQGWGICYLPEGSPSDYKYLYGSEDCIIHEGPHEGTYYSDFGSDRKLYALEHIEGNWYFYYMDFDNNRHGLNWTASAD